MLHFNALEDNTKKFPVLLRFRDHHTILPARFTLAWLFVVGGDE